LFIILLIYTLAGIGVLWYLLSRLLSKQFAHYHDLFAIYSPICCFVGGSPMDARRCRGCVHTVFEFGQQLNSKPGQKVVNRVMRDEMPHIAAVGTRIALT